MTQFMSPGGRDGLNDHGVAAIYGYAMTEPAPRNVKFFPPQRVRASSLVDRR
jgi:hypothetical protein